MILFRTFRTLKKTKIPRRLIFYRTEENYQDYLKSEMELEYNFKGAVTLNEKEQQIFDLLKEVKKVNNLETVMRVAGGWVRDKLLGLESQDIDIALDNMMGEEFAKLIQAHMQSQNQESRGFGVIKANPEKSKHLETATINIYDLWIDLVNLRKEEYAENSRIPTIGIGTPEEDAFRRDLTINALFYNINTGLVEDFTKKGLPDLERGYVRTPLDPLTTFKDDPLRILRVFRFASRYDFACDEQMVETIKRDDVKAAFLEKISKERVGKELQPALEHRNHLIYLNYLQKVDLFPTIFKAPASLSGPKDYSHENLQAYFGQSGELWAQARELALKLSPKLTERTENDKERRLLISLTALLHGFNRIKKFKEVKKMTLVEYQIRENLKLSKDLAKKIDTICDGVYSLLELGEKGELGAVSVGMWCRGLKDLWPYSVFILGLIEDGKYAEYQDEALGVIEEHELSGFWKIRPILNGNDIKKTLGVQPKQIRYVMEAVLKYQILNREASKEDCLEHFKTNLEPQWTGK